MIPISYTLNQHFTHFHITCFQKSILAGQEFIGFNKQPIRAHYLSHVTDQQPITFHTFSDEYKKMAGQEFIGFSNATFLSEKSCADQNFAIGYFLKEHGVFPPSELKMGK